MATPSGPIYWLPSLFPKITWNNDDTVFYNVIQSRYANEGIRGVLDGAAKMCPILERGIYYIYINTHVYIYAYIK